MEHGDYQEDGTGTRPAAPPRVHFGDGDTQELPFAWAEKGLCWLYRERRNVFADMMLFVMDTGLTTGRASRGGNGRQP